VAGHRITAHHIATIVTQQINHDEWARGLEAANQAFAAREHALAKRIAEVSASLEVERQKQAAAARQAAKWQQAHDHAVADSTQRLNQLTQQLAHSNAHIQTLELAHREASAQLSARTEASVQVEKLLQHAHSALAARTQEAEASTARLFSLVEDSARERDALRQSSAQALANAQQFADELRLQAKAREDAFALAVQTTSESLEALRGELGRMRAEHQEALDRAMALAQAQQDEARAEAQRAQSLLITLHQDELRLAKTELSRREEAFGIELAALQQAGQVTRAGLEQALNAAESQVEELRASLLASQVAAEHQRHHHASELDLLQARLRAADEHVNAAGIQARAKLALQASLFSAHAAALRTKRRRALILAKSARAADAAHTHEARLRLTTLQQSVRALREQLHEREQHAASLQESLAAAQFLQEALRGRVAQVTHRLTKSNELLSQAETLRKKQPLGSLNSLIATHLQEDARPLVMLYRHRQPPRTLNTMTHTRPPQHLIDSPDLAALLSLPGPIFVHAVYLVMLGREPDPEGMAFFRARLLEGVSKLQILGEFGRSEEHIQRKLELPGLNAALHRERQAQLGWRRRLLRFLGVQAQHAGLERQLNRLEARVDEELQALELPVWTSTTSSKPLPVESGFVSESVATEPTSPPTAPAGTTPQPYRKPRLPSIQPSPMELMAIQGRATSQ
jgi:hypothetical protein